MPPGTINKPNRKALKVRREKIRTKKKNAGAEKKHNTQVKLLVERNPKRARKLAKRAAALARAAAAEPASDEPEMAEVKTAKAKAAGQKGKKAAGDEMQE